MSLNQAWWLKLLILATQEAEIGRIMIRGQPRLHLGLQDPMSANKSWVW
jgi:hypothetical protein